MANRGQQDKIAAENKIGTCTVSNIINEWKKGVDDADYKSIRELAVMNKAIFLVPVIACLFTGAAASVTVQQGQALTSGKNTIKTIPLSI